MNRATCRDCGKKITVTQAGVLREHGHPANRCPGGGEKPAQEHTPWIDQARREPPPLEITPRRDPLAEPRTTPVSLRPKLSTEYVVNAMPVDETMWRQAQQLLDDAGYDDVWYVVPGDPATGKPIRHHIVTQPGVEIIVRMTADGERWEVGGVS